MSERMVESATQAIRAALDGQIESAWVSHIDGDISIVDGYVDLKELARAAVAAVLNDWRKGGATERQSSDGGRTPDERTPSASA
jgi:hypothetical protein